MIDWRTILVVVIVALVRVLDGALFGLTELGWNMRPGQSVLVATVAGEIVLVGDATTSKMSVGVPRTES